MSTLFNTIQTLWYKKLIAYGNAFWRSQKSFKLSRKHHLQISKHQNLLVLNQSQIHQNIAIYA